MSQLRQYEALWNLIAKAEGRQSILCQPSMVQTIIQAVRKEKSRHNITRKQLDMPRYGKLYNEQEKLPDGRVRISFWLAYNGDKL